MGDTKSYTDSYDFAKVPQPAWGHSDSMSSNTQPIREGIVYKLTRIPGVFVQRGAAVFKDRCVTYHEPGKTTDATTWMLDRGCNLLPSNASELGPKKRGIRPKGTWAITAAVQGVETYLEVYEIKIDWPPSWATTGYTDLVLGFTDRAEAVRWHEALAAVLAGLAAAGKGHHSRSSSIKAQVDLTCTSTPVGALNLESAFARAASTASATGTSTSQMNPLVSSRGPAATCAITTAMDGDTVASETDSETDEEDSPTPGDQRWVPYRQTNGMAIYYHAGEDRKPGAGEYMVSCGVRGQPHRVAAALMRLRGNTTMLGPAAHVELLQPAEDKMGETVKKELLRMVLTATGSAGYFCAPREVVLERIRKEEDDGVVVIMFKSVELANETAVPGNGNLYGSGLYRRPVRAMVAGGYTIAGLRGEGASSPESLVTCIVKLDLGGVCGPGSWARRLASAAGWVDSFLDRILMSVHLLRDEVEQRRFSVQPFKLVTSAKARLNEDGEVVGSTSAEPFSAASLTRSATSLSKVPKLTARMASQRLSAPLTERVPASVSAIVEEGGEDPMDISMLRLDVARVHALVKLPRRFWTEVQVPGTDAPFHIRGATYLKDKKKTLAEPPAFNLGGVELLELPAAGTEVAGVIHSTGVVEHLARFLPCVREGGAPFSIIICLVIPGSPMLTLASVFCCDKHPSILGAPPSRPMDEQHDWQPFDFVLHKFVYGSDETRNKMLKMIPHVASGSWMIKQSVGSTPVLIGKALKTTYHCNPTYIEVDIDISANSVANYVTGMVRGATTSLDVDLAFVLEGSAPWELPECLLGAFRLTRLDCKAAKALDWTRELPIAGRSGSSKLLATVEAIAAATGGQMSGTS